MHSLKFAFRMLAKTPFVTLVAVVSLAFGIGGNAAIFSIFNQILLKSVPATDSSRLVNLGAPGPKPGSQSCSQAGDCDEVFSYLMFRDLQKAQSVLTGIAAHRGFDANFAFKGETVHGEGMMVSGSYFQVLELTPALGRLINSGDDATIDSLVVVLTYWSTRFGEPQRRQQHLIVTAAAAVCRAARLHGTTLDRGRRCSSQSRADR
jgi:hypothetical protein